MTTPTEGTPATAEQAVTGTQPTQGQPQTTTAPVAQTAPEQSAQEPATQQTPTAPDAAALQAQLAEMQQRYQQLEQSARYHQSRADQLRVALTGNEPQQDPLAPYVQKLVAKGYDAKEARDIAELQYEMVQPILQQQQATQSALMGQTQLPMVLNQVCQGNAALSSVYQELYSTIQQDVARGNMNALNPEYIKTIGARLYLDQMSSQRGPAPQAQVPPPMPQFGSQFGPIGGFNPPQAQPQQTGIPPHIKAAQDAERAAVNQRLGIQSSPQNPS